MQVPHISVLLHEVLSTFKDIPKNLLVDCTLGFGGHSEALLMQNQNLHIIACDKDKSAIEFSKKRLERFRDRVKYFNASFSETINKINKENIGGILADIGVSSWQLDEKSRGFGFDSDKLDMRMNQEQDLSAFEILNNYSEEDLSRVFRDFGEISSHKELARQIVKKRSIIAFENPRQLCDMLKNRKERGRKVSLATLVFQAIRIEVNDELGELRRLLDSVEKMKLKKAKIAIISFHSLEDRIVKNTFKKWTKKCICPSDFYKCECSRDCDLGKILTKKPITPQSEELSKNPRARSAKMRVFEFGE